MPPSLPPAHVRAYIASEYNTSYATKAEDSKLNPALVKLAANMQTKTVQQQKRSVLAKSINALGCTMQYGTVIAASYLLGNEDSWSPMRDVMHDFDAFAGLMLNRAADILADERVKCKLARTAPETVSKDSDAEGSESDGSESEAEEVDAADACDLEEKEAEPEDQGVLSTMTAVDLYMARHRKLDSWSPFEMEMAFTVVSKSTEASEDLPLSTAKEQYHKPRLTVGAESTFAIPRPYREHPHRPLDSAMVAERNVYAAWAIGNFFPDRLLHEIRDEESSDLWTMYCRWNSDRPRGSRDDFAFQCMENIHERHEAREHIRKELREKKERDAIFRKNHPEFAYSDDMDEVRHDCSSLA